MTDRPRALAVLISVFLLGCVLGSAGSYMWLRRSVAPERESRRGQFGPPQGRQRMQEFLNLTPEQDTQFKKIMQESRRKIDSLRAEQWPAVEAVLSKQRTQIEAIMTETNRQLRSLLTEEQKKKFDAFLKEMEGRRRQPHEPRGMGPPPPPSGRR